jgi:hypothetical protein
MVSLIECGLTALSSFKGFFGIMTFVLVSSGWVFIKPFLTEKDKRIISLVIPLQVRDAKPIQ